MDKKGTRAACAPNYGPIAALLMSIYIDRNGSSGVMLKRASLRGDLQTKTLKHGQMHYKLMLIVEPV